MPLLPLRTVVLTFLLVLIVFGKWCYSRPLLTAAPAAMVEHVELAPIAKHHIEHITLFGDELGSIGIAISIPDPVPRQRLPVIMILGGLDTAEHTLANVPNPGNNIIVSYDWPMPLHPPSGLGFLWALPSLYKKIMLAPAQIAAALDWVAAQPWADESRMSILGFSLGAL
ncbi:MAG: hypothetical protein M3N08_09620, partial [Pseudomonadota bacterium]|nr:hypothetical protein [Pseudomonadota bacterium]